MCLKVLERAAHFEDNLAKLENQISPEDGRVHLRLKAEYFILRTALVSISFNLISMQDYHSDSNT